MRTAEQVEWDFVQQWLSKAHQDLQAAKVLLSSTFDDYGGVAFHAQQAAEKFIKAVLVRHQVEFPKTHDIARLRDLVARTDRALAARLAPTDTLTPYGVEYRYPGDLGPVSRQKAASAVQLAEAARDAAIECLRAYLNAGRPQGDQPTEQR